MPEDVLRLGVAAELSNDVGANERRQLFLDVVAVRDLLQDAQKEASPDHGGELRQAPASSGRASILASRRLSSVGVSTFGPVTVGAHVCCWRSPALSAKAFRSSSR